MDERYKYVYWYFEDAAKDIQPTEELFDLERDPYELVNQSGQPEYLNVLKEMRGLYDRQLDHWRTEGVKYNGYEKYEVLFGRSMPQ